MFSGSKRGRLFLIIFALVFGTLPEGAQAVPSFARQTGLPCSGCHPSFYQLNAFGRQFKLNGYTMTTVPTITTDNLKLLGLGPISAMFQGSYTRTNKKQDGTTNDNVEFPQEMSVFLAGALTPNVGAFTQATYEQQSGDFGVDNIDIRYAKNEGDFTWGIDANNNPTVQDVWNSTPAWGFPINSSDSAPEPAAATQLEETLAQRVAGIGGYIFYDNLVYGELSMYKSADQGAASPPNGDSTDTIDGASPYWRFALQKQLDETNYLEVGTFGLYTQQYPEGVTGTTDKFTDIGFDSQYEHSFGTDSLVARATWIYEHQKPDATFAAGGAENNSGDINSFKVNATYYMDGLYAFSLGYFNLFGDRDGGLYGPAEDGTTISRNGKPDTDGFIAEVDYSPWMNTKFALQYTFYDKFNGSSSNYDGAGRSASDNDTLFLLGWLAF